MEESFPLRRWPQTIDELCSALRKGDTVTAGELETIFGCHRESAKFGTRVAGLTKRIKRNFRERVPSLRVTITYPQSGVHVCDDEEAVSVTEANFRRDYRGMLEAGKDASGVIVENLPPAIAQRHEMALHAQGVALGAIRAAMRPKLWIKAQREGDTPRLAAPE